MIDSLQTQLLQIVLELIRGLHWNLSHYHLLRDHVPSHHLVAVVCLVTGKINLTTKTETTTFPDIGKEIGTSQIVREIDKEIDGQTEAGVLTDTVAEMWIEENV